MENSASISWKGNEVGRVSNVMNDMWYLDADWFSNESENALRFEEIASKLNAEEVIKSPLKGIIALLDYGGSTSDPQKVLVLKLEESKIFMRIVSDELAAYADLSLLEPWQSTDDPTYYEKELRKEITFFHPLNWKRVRAIGIRTDRDDVLFEILNGSSKYAVAHLTYKKGSSRKFPATHFYKDWEDLYKNRLLKDHEEWKED